MIRRAIELLRSRSRILVFTGAGVSTASGIPDFRGPNGVWTRVDPAEFTYQRYVADPAVRRRSWAMRQGSGVFDAKPNPAHTAVVDLWRAGAMETCVTQNIDGLHQRAGLPDEAVVELHGTAHRCRCLGCPAVWDSSAILDRVAGGDDDPHCEHCGSIIKVAVISFGEEMPTTAMHRALTAADDCDAVISAGSTLSVYPAADVPLRAAGRHAPYIIINRGETAHDRLADVVIDGDVTSVLPALVEGLT